MFTQNASAIFDYMLVGTLTNCTIHQNVYLIVVKCISIMVTTTSHMYNTVHIIFWVRYREYTIFI